MTHSLALGGSNLANPPTNAPTPHATAKDAITDAHVHGRRVAVAVAIAHRDIAVGRARARRRLAYVHTYIKKSLRIITTPTDPNVRTNGRSKFERPIIIIGRVVVVVISTCARPIDDARSRVDVRSCAANTRARIDTVIAATFARETCDRHRKI